MNSLAHHYSYSGMGDGEHVTLRLSSELLDWLPEANENFTRMFPLIKSTGLFLFHADLCYFMNLIYPVQMITLPTF